MRRSGTHKLENSATTDAASSEDDILRTPSVPAERSVGLEGGVVVEARLCDNGALGLVRHGLR